MKNYIRPLFGPLSFALLLRPSFLLVLLAFAWPALSPSAQGQLSPPPDGGYPSHNTAEGANALFHIDVSRAVGNTAIGDSALSENNSGSTNTALGVSSLLFNTTGSDNTAVGAFALEGNNASGNTAVGSNALFSNSSGTNNTAIGIATLDNNTTGADNTATGAGALGENTTGADNTATGSGSLGQNTIGNDNTGTGFEVLASNTSGTANTASGLHAMQFNTTGSDNTASGLIALQSNTTGGENTALGAFALATNTTGKNNTAEGSGALANSTTGSNNVAVGFDAGLNLKSGGNNIIIGANVPGTASDANTIRVGKQGTQKSTFIAGIFGTAMSGSTVVVNSTGKLGVATSSARFKEAIKPMDKASKAIFDLKPVTFRYKEEVDPDKVPQFGLVAEEVEKVDPNLVVHDEEGKPFTVRYEAVNEMLLNEFLKEHRKVEAQEHKAQEQEARLTRQDAIIARQQKQIEALTATMQKVSERFEMNTAAPQLVADNQ
jgi:hypothetical protein